MANDKEFLNNIEAIQSELDSTGSQFADLGVEQICSAVGKIRPWLEVILPYIDKIPGFGGTLATVLRLLLKLADAVCPK